MKLFLQNCFQALLCLYRSHPKYQKAHPGAPPTSKEDLLALARLGARYPCTLLALRWLGTCLAACLSTPRNLAKRLPSPNLHTHPDLISGGEWITSGPAQAKRGAGFVILDFFVTFLVKQKSKAKKKHGSGNPAKLLPFLINRGRSTITRTSPRLAFLHNRSRLSWLAPIFLCLLFLNGKVAEAQSTGGGNAAPVVIYGELHGLDSGQQVRISHWPHYLDMESNYPVPVRTEIPPAKGLLFQGTALAKTFLHQTEPASGTQVLSVYVGGGTLMDRYLVEPGDSIHLLADFRNASLAFAGRSAHKMNAQREIRLAQEAFAKNLPPVMFAPDREALFGPEETLLDYQNSLRTSHPMAPTMQVMDFTDADIPILGALFALDGGLHAGWKVLDAYSTSLGPGFAALLEADLWARIGYFRLSRFSASYRPSEARDRFYDRNIRHMELVGRDNPAAWDSPAFLDLAFEYCTLKAIIERQPVFDVYAAFPAGLSERLMARYLARFHNRIPDPGQKFERALAETRTPWVTETLLSILGASAMGTPVPDEPLTDPDGNPLFPSSLRGKVLLVDFWFTGCGACATKYRQYIKPVGQHFGDSDKFAILSVNTDRKAATWRKSIAGDTYTSPSSVNAWTGGTDHALLRRFNVVSFPRLLLVDAEGRIALSGKLPDGPEGMIALIESLLQHRP